MYIINDMKSLSLLYCLKWLAHIQSLPHGRRKWQPTPVFLPGESHGQRSLVLSIGSHRVGDNWSDLACMHALEKEMATHSSILAWRIPGTEEPGGLLSMGSHRVGYDWSDLAVYIYIWSEILHPWDFPGNSTGVGCHFLLQGIISTEGSNLGLLHCRQMLYHLSH